MKITVDNLFEKIKEAKESGHGDKIVHLAGCDCIGRWNGEFIITNDPIAYDPKEILLLMRHPDD